MDGSGLEPLAAMPGMPVTVELLGVEEGFDAEIERLAELVTQPCVWIGHSLGGIAALHLAARYPACCAAVVVLASNARPDGPHGADKRSGQCAALDRGGMAAVLHEQLAAVYGIRHGDRLLDGLLEQAHRVGADRFRRQLRYAAERPGLLRASPALPMPVLALSGSSDPLCPPACGDEVIALSSSPLSRHEVLAGAGHLFPLQSPGWCVRHIHHFLAQLA